MKRSRSAWSLAVVDLVAFVVASFADPHPDPGAIALYLVGIASFVAVGALLVERVPTNPIGALLLAAGTCAVAAAVIGTYADVGVLQAPVWPGAATARRIGDVIFIYPIVIALVWIPLIFPDGRLPSRRFRWVVVATVAMLIGWTLGGVFGLDFGPIVLFGTLVGFGGAATAVILRFRRGDTVQRQQVKWLAAIVVVAAVVLPIGLLLYDIAFDVSNLLIIIGILALFTLPVVIGIAILRYRLYEIDRIVSRTLAYAAVTGILAVVYAGAIVILSSVLAQVAQGETIAVAASTLAVFALFQPVLRRVRRTIDRRFDRAAYDAERTVAAFSERLRWQTEMPLVTADLASTAGTAVAPTKLGIWIREKGR